MKSIDRGSLGVLAVLLALSLWASAGQAADSPNLVVIMMDDLADSTYDAAAALDYSSEHRSSPRARVSDPHLTNSTVLPVTVQIASDFFEYQEKTRSITSVYEHF